MISPVPRSSVDLLARVDASWRAFRSALDALAPDRLDAPSTGSWTLRDVVSHVAAWLEECPKRIEIVRAGGRDPIDTSPASIDAFNARAVEARRELRSEAIVNELDDAFRRARKAVSSLTDDEIVSGSLNSGLLSIAAWDTFLHFDEHAKDLVRRPAGSAPR